MTNDLCCVTLLQTTMVDVRYHALAATTLILLGGTVYSVLYNTYLDTSNPLLADLPHPLSKSHFFASKSNPLNVYFIKRAWAWTTAAFLFNFITSPKAVRTRERLFKYFTLTAIWILFVNWFFGPAILERVIVYSGGECIATLSAGNHITVPNEFCFSKVTVSPHTHPTLFEAAVFSSPEVKETLRLRPRFRRGHDLSGHVFLLTMSILFLADQLRPSFSQRAGKTWSTLHGWAVAAHIGLIFIWFLALYTTAKYFHNPMEKFTGYRTCRHQLSLFE